MFYLIMKPRPGDVLRLLAGRLYVDDELRADWLRRGREVLQPAIDRQSSGAFEGLATGIPVKLRLFDVDDQTPVEIRERAYRVEARRCLLSSLNDWSMTVLAAVIIASLCTTFVSGLLWGAALAAAGLSVVGLMHARGVRMSRQAVELRQGLEPLVWALYYPVQLAERVLVIDEHLRNSNEPPLSVQIEEVQSTIRRAEDGHALPGQDEQVRKAALFLYRVVPSVFGTVDVGRSMASLILQSAEAARELVALEYKASLNPRGSRQVARAADVIAAGFARRAYNFLMDEANNLAGVPRPRPGEADLALPLHQLVELPTFKEMVKESRTLLVTAERLAGGIQPTAINEWSPSAGPGASRWMAVAFFAAVGGFLYFQGLTDYAQVMINVAALFIPGLVGQVIKESSALAAVKPSVT